MIKFINILKEEYDFSLKKPYIKLFKLLHKEGFKGEDTKEVYKFLRSRLELNPDNSSIITVLYKKNYKEDGNYDDINQDNWIGAAREVLVDQDILGQFFGYSPEIFKSEGGKYFPLIPVLYSGYYVNNISIVPYQSIRETAIREVKTKFDEEGFDLFDDGWLEKYIYVEEDVAIYNAEERALEAFNNYLEKKKRDPELAKWSKHQLLEDIGMRDEYEETVEYVEEYLEDIKIIEDQNLELNHKLNKIEEEREIITLEIERLSDTVDYGDDEQEYYSSYKEDIDELESTLHDLESKYYTISNLVDDNDKEISELEGKLSYHYDTYRLYVDDEEFKELYMDLRVPIIVEEYTNEPLQYIHDSALTIDEAVEEGMVSVDMREMFSDAVAHDGVDEWLHFGSAGYFTEIYRYEGMEYYLIIKPGERAIVSNRYGLAQY